MTRSLALLTALLSMSTVAFAEGNYRLDYSAPPECIAKERFADEVAARAGRLVFNDTSPASVAVRIVRDGDTFLATLQVDGQSRVATASTCESATTQLAEAAAVLFQAEAPVVAPAAQASDEIPVRLTADAEGFTAHRIAMQAFGQSGTVSVSVTGTERLCTAPCQFSIRPGLHELAGAPDAQSGIRTRGTVLDFRAPSELHASYTNRSGLRLGLLIGGLVMLVAGGATMFAATSSEDNFDALLFGGMGGALAGAAVVWAATLIPDTAEWQLRPLR